MTVGLRILAVDDEIRGVELLERALRGLGTVQTALSGEEALEIATAEPFDVVVSDHRMPGMTGVELLTLLADAVPLTARILLTAHADTDSAIDAINLGRVHAYLAKPCAPTELRKAIESVIARASRTGRREEVLLPGVSAPMRDLREQVRQVAALRIPVLIRGETGTGKELVARALHAESPRARHPFVAVNCGALPETLLESELFGCERGAFSGAERARRGLFEQANEGTLFLDEIGDTTPSLQVSLLRAIETGEIRPLGSTVVRSADVRVVSATHQDLEGMVSQGSFRQDLLYRLNAVTLEVPPLRQRRVDIPYLARRFAAELGVELGREISLGDDCLATLSAYGFPGNVRELRNAIESAVARARPSEPISLAQLPPALRGQAPVAPLLGGSLRQRVEQLEIQAIREALAQHDGNRTRAAEALGLSRMGMRQKMRRYGLVDPASD